MENGLVKSSWLMLAKELNLTPGSVQCTEMEKTYFTGAWMIMNSVRIIGEKELEDDVAAQILDAIWQECEAFRISQQFDPEKN